MTAIETIAAAITAYLADLGVHAAYSVMNRLETSNTFMVSDELGWDFSAFVTETNIEIAGMENLVIEHGFDKKGVKGVFQALEFAANLWEGSEEQSAYRKKAQKEFEQDMKNWEKKNRRARGWR